MRALLYPWFCADILSILGILNISKCLICNLGKLSLSIISSILIYLYIYTYKKFKF